MQRILLALACLACMSHGQQVGSSLEQPQKSRPEKSQRPNQVKSLAALLLKSDATAAFNPSSLGARLPKHKLADDGRKLPMRDTSQRSLLDDDAARRAPMTNMLKETLTDQELISDEFQQTLNDAALLLMRLTTAAVMIHHGQEKILSPQLFTKYTIDQYFGFLPGPHIFYAYAAGYVQFFAPILLSLGVFSRLAGASLVAVMSGAFFYTMLNTGLEGFPFLELQGLGAKLKFGVPAFHNYGFEPVVLYLAIFLLSAVNGPGKLSIAQLLGWNDDKSLLGKLKQ